MAGALDTAGHVCAAPALRDYLAAEQSPEKSREAALANPEAFLARLADAATPGAIKMLLAKLRPKLEPMLKKQQLEWSDVSAAGFTPAPLAPPATPQPKLQSS